MPFDFKRNQLTLTGALNGLVEPAGMMMASPGISILLTVPSRKMQGWP